MHYYNEFDPQAAAWLQVLIDQHLIPEGVVDTRSIVEVTAADLGGFVQCHFFAGIGGWPLALQLAGVPASTRLWTGSCPCQPFSVAGEGKGTADERHLWPVFFELIRACNPPLVFGEQVASAAVLGSSAKPTKRSAGKAVQPVWLDGVFADLESAGYTCGSSDIPAAGGGSKMALDCHLLHGMTPDGTPAGMANTEGFQLNPFFSMWLMSFPVEWTLAGILALKKFRSLQKPPKASRSPARKPSKSSPEALSDPDC